MELLEEYTELEKKEMELATLRNEILSKHEGIFNAIKELDTQASELANRKAEMKEQLLVAMENSNVKKFENDILTITYVAPTTRVGVDTDKLKAEYEEVYLQCIKETPVKASIRIKLK
jgi:predicted phage-related endonuclease